jgi:hypothetical protein
LWLAAPPSGIAQNLVHEKPRPHWMQAGFSHRMRAGCGQPMKTLGGVANGLPTPTQPAIGSGVPVVKRHAPIVSHLAVKCLVQTESRTGGLMMIHTSVVMVRCPATGRELSTGEMDAATFERLPDIRSRIKCPVCNLDHDWSTRDAWLGNPAPPSAPALPWLFINNLSAAND